MKNYKRLLSYLKPYLKHLAVAVVCMVLSSASNLSVPMIVSKIIDKVLADRNMMQLNYVSIGILILSLLRSLFFFGQHYLMSYVGQRVVVDLRRVMYRKFQRMPLAYYDKHLTGEVMSFITNDVAAVQGALANQLVMLVTEVSVFVGSISMMIYLDWKMTIMTVITVPFVGQSMKFFGNKLKSAGGNVQSSLAVLTSFLQESISAIRVVKSFAREEYEIKRYDEAIETTFQAAMLSVRLRSMLTPTVEFLAAIGVTAIIWFGGHEVVNGSMTTGELVAFLTYAINLANPIKRISQVFSDIQLAMGGADRVFNVMDMEEPVSDKPDAVEMPPIKGNISVKDVTFKYNEEADNAIQHVSFDVKPGQMVAFVGPSGAGKSTIANLLPRFYDVNEGAITIDGYDVRDVKAQSLREQIGIVPQETMLFSGSVWENIRFGRLDATDEEIVEAAKAANADEFIRELPKGYDTNLGERGLNLSGGQRQRLAIARALLKNPKILILDEATSALDTESERIVQAALERLMVGRTSLVIAHRLSTIIGADRIIVINRGQVVEDGTHEELLALGGVYSNLYNVQFNNV